MNLKQMTARVFRALPSLPPGSIGEHDIVDMLNEGLQKIAKISNKEAALNYEVPSGTDTIAFPVDMLKLANAYWGKDKRELEMPMTSMPLDDGTETGEPRRIHVADGHFTVRPVPARGDTLTITYIRKPTEMVEDEDVPDIEGTEEFLVANALYKIHLEANSQAFQIWEMEAAKALAVFMQVENENYALPFRVTAQW